MSGAGTGLAAQPTTARTVAPATPTTVGRKHRVIPDSLFERTFKPPERFTRTRATTFRLDARLEYVYVIRYT